jgi:hypothetical protein
MLVLTRDEENMKIFSRRKGFAPRTQPCRMWTVEFWFFDATMKRIISKQTRKARGTIARVALVLLFSMGLFLSMLPFGRATARAALLLPSLMTASEPAPVRFVNEPVRHTQMTATSHHGPVYLDIYAPPSAVPPIPGERGGVIIVPGVGDHRDLPQLVNFSQSLAGKGLVVMLMTTPTLIRYDISLQDSDGVIEAFRILARWPNVRAERIGLIAFSAGVPLACFAAADPHIRDQIAFVTLFGGYFDTTTLLRAFGQRAIMIDGRMQPWKPQIVPIRVLSTLMMKTLPPAEQHLLVKSFTPGGKPLSPSDLALLSPPAAATYHLLAGDRPDQVDTHLAALDTEMQRQLAELSPNRVIHELRAPIYLLHDRNDDSLPITQSRDFAAVLGSLGHPHDFAEFGIFHHVQYAPAPIG